MRLFWDAVMTLVPAVIPHHDPVHPPPPPPLDMTNQVLPLYWQRTLDVPPPEVQSVLLPPFVTSYSMPVDGDPTAFIWVTVPFGSLPARLVTTHLPW